MDARERSGFSRGDERSLFSLLKVLSAALMVFAATVVAPAGPSYASGGGSVALYFSAPFVTGSHVTDGALTETFNGYGSSGDVPCPTNIAGFATVAYTSSNCTIGNRAGTSAGSSEPAIGVPISSFVNKTVDTTFTFANPVKYVGFWWMLGSTGNNVEFLDSNGIQVADFNVNDVVTFLGSNSLVSNADTRTVTRVDNTSGAPKTHLTKHYYRSPTNYTGTLDSPVMNYDALSYANEPFIYLNLFVSGDVSVSKVRFSGADFEMDNLTVSTVEQTPRGDMVFVGGLIGKSVQFLPGAPDVTGSMVAQGSTTAANLSANRYERAGYTFTGWNTAENGTGDSYAAGANFNFATDLTLYAQWELATSSGGGGSSVAPVASTAPQLAATGVEIPVGLLAALGTLGLGVVAIVASKGLARRRSR
jgi:uncharacterized repeat protein (TIGR02543 family)